MTTAVSLHFSVPASYVAILKFPGEVTREVTVAVIMGHTSGARQN